MKEFLANEKLIIRGPKSGHYFIAFSSGLLLLNLFIGPFDQTRLLHKGNPTIGIVLALLLFGIFLHSLKKLIRQKLAITISREGIELRERLFPMGHDQILQDHHLRSTRQQRQRSPDPAITNK